MGEESKTKFSVGDLVIVTTVPCIHDLEHYSPGHVGAYSGESLINFNIGDNEFVDDDGFWFVDDSSLKHYTPIEDLPLWKSNHMYLDDEQQQALRKLLHRVQWDEEYAENIQFRGLTVAGIEYAFTWKFTTEGERYWLEASEQCDNEEIKQSIIPNAVREEIKSLHSFAECVIVEDEDTDRIDYTSEYFLQRAIDLQKERGKEYDNGTERSMHKTVEVFNIITGKQLSESEGWLFMQVLKDVRQWTKPEYHQDSAEDCVSYAALKAEALASGK